MTCACGASTTAPDCHFCSRTIELISSRRCVACTAPIEDGERQEGRCAECRWNEVALCAATRRHLHLAADVRYHRRARMAA